MTGKGELIPEEATLARCRPTALYGVRWGGAPSPGIGVELLGQADANTVVLLEPHIRPHKIVERVRSVRLGREEATEAGSGGDGVNKTYSSQFFDKIREGSRRSALRVLPGVLELARPASVVDVGCGAGTWASVCHELGVAKVLGIDGDHVDRASLCIPADEFMPFDLTKPLPPIGIFDLVVSLEVAEHLPEECASTFVISLCSLGDVVLFSAAIPFQGGDDHRNEQWPEYWAKMFAGQGFECFDVVRPRVWDDADVEYWYAQNTLLFVRTSAVPRYPALIGAVPSNTALARVHPQKWMLTKDKKRRAQRNWLRQRARAWWQVLRGQSS